MRALAIALACLASPQEDVERIVSGLVERLSDDRVDVREKAARELTALGPKALPAVRRRLETADVEARERLGAVVREIERLDRLRFFLGGEDRVSLKADRWPVGKVLEELARQNPTPVLLKDAAESGTVSVDLKAVLFFEALHRICLAHGGLVMRLPGGTHVLEDHSPVELVRGDPTACRPFVEGPFAVSLESVYVADSWDFRGKREAHPTLNFTLGWERGTRPILTKLAIRSVVDEEGRTYRAASTGAREGRMDVFVWRSTWVNLDPAPPASVRSFREIAGTAEIEFPSDGHVARLERPLGRTGIEAAGGTASFTLRELVRDGPDTVRATVEAGWTTNHFERIRFFALDGRDRIYAPEGEKGTGSGGRMKYAFRLDIPDGEEVKELRAVTLAAEKGRTVRRTIEWKLGDVRFR